eukprot:ANDGO_06406.mRNA.1 hypothetical protein
MAQQLENLAGVLGSLQSNFAHAYSQLAQNLSSTQQVVQQFNTVMEQLLVQGILIRIQHIQGCVFSISVQNRSKFSIPSVTVSASVTEPEVSIRVASLEFVSPSWSMDVPAELGAGSTWKTLLNVAIPSGTRANVIVSARFPSPGTGNLLATCAEFGVYALYTWTPTSAAQLPASSLSVKRNEPVAIKVDLLRRLLRIRPADAVPLPDAIVAFRDESGCMHVAFRSFQVSEDGESVSIEVLSASLELMELVYKELELLSC